MALSANHITTATATQVKTGTGYFHKLVFNKPGAAADTVTIYDNTASSGTVIAIVTITADLKPFELVYDVRFTTGLRVVTSGTPDLTVVYQ